MNSNECPGNPWECRVTADCYAAGECRRDNLVFRNGGDKPVVALDIDGTLGDYHAHFLTFAQEWLGQPMPHPSDINPRLPLHEFMGISHELYRQIKLAYRQGGLKRTMTAYPGAAELTGRIRAMGAQVWICTTRPYLRLDNIDPDTREWLRRNEIEYDAILFDDLDGVTSGGHKPGGKYGELMEQVGPRVVACADDLPDQLIAAFAAGVPMRYLRDQPYNQPTYPDGDDALPGNGDRRVYSLYELFNYLSIDIQRWKRLNER